MSKPATESIDLVSALARIRRATIVYAVVNLIGMCVFYAVVEGIVAMARREERVYDFGDSLNFLEKAVPAFLLCALYSVGWAVKAAMDIRRHRDYQASIALMIIVAAWTTVYLLARMSA